MYSKIRSELTESLRQLDALPVKWASSCSFPKNDVGQRLLYPRATLRRWAGKPGGWTERSLECFQLNPDPLALKPGGGKLPNIGVAVACGPRDIPCLSMTMFGAIAGSRNPIDSATVVIPERYLESGSAELVHFSSVTGIDVEWTTDESVLGIDLISQIRAAFGRRSNWVIQQYLKVWTVARSNSRGLLLIDADTVLLRKRTWLLESQRQVLLPSDYFHSPYYRFLGMLSPIFSAPLISFVSHHALMQPDVFRTILAEIGCSGPESLHDRAVNLYDRSTESPFSLEYDLYSNALEVLRPDLGVRAKWSNIGKARSDIVGNPRAIEYLSGLARDYFSVSLHHYLV